MSHPNLTHADLLVTQIDNLLPQTQCQDCEYESCLLYAEAIAHNDEAINKCLPGGVSVLKTLGDLLQQDVSPFLAETEQTAKHKKLAIIVEQECIGCTKCIQACPVDAILGATKLMHTVINHECTGCGLCVEPCPMDCIDMVLAEDQSYQPEHARSRFNARTTRLQKQKDDKALKHKASLNFNKVKSDKDNSNKSGSDKASLNLTHQNSILASKKAAIAAAVAREKAKRARS